MGCQAAQARRFYPHLPSSGQAFGRHSAHMAVRLSPRQSLRDAGRKFETKTNRRYSAATETVVAALIHPPPKTRLPS